LFTNTSSVSQSGIVDYQWIFGDSSSSTLVSPSHIYKAEGNYTVKLVVTPRDCKQLAVSKTLPLIIQLSEIPIRYKSLYAINGKDLLLKAREYSGASYIWAPTVGLNRSNVYNPIFNHTAPQKYQIKITTAAGCEFTDTLEVMMFSSQEIYVPKVFSPNGDGKNDKLHPFLIGVTNLKFFKVFNRWGQLVFQTRNEAEGWDGVYLGSLQPMGTYSWQAEGLDIDGKVIFRTGSTILIR
jgi:gliding motility-associated-like protein